MHEKEREILIHSAYYDELTEIHNRRYCSEYMNKIEESDMQTTAVLCFDVNNLWNYFIFLAVTINNWNSY